MTATAGEELLSFPLAPNNNDAREWAPKVRRLYAGSVAWLVSAKAPIGKGARQLRLFVSPASDCYYSTVYGTKECH